MTPPSDQEGSHAHLCSASKELFHVLGNTSKGTLKSQHRHIGGSLLTLKDKSQTKGPRESRRTNKKERKKTNKKLNKRNGFEKGLQRDFLRERRTSGLG